VQFKLAILNVLAKYPDGHAELNELKREVEAFTSHEDPPEQISSALDDIDIFQSGLVIPDGDGLRITDAGRSALKAMEDSSKPSLDLPPGTTSHSLKLIDDLIGTQERLKIFDLELRELGEDVDFNPVQKEAAPQPTATEMPAAAREAGSDDPADDFALQPPQEADPADPGINEMIATNPREAEPQDAPTFLMHGFGSGARASAQRPARWSWLFSSIATSIRSARRFWRGHLEQELPNAGRPPGNARGGLFALLALFLMVVCAGAVIALAQIKSLRSEIATLQRELLPLKERLARAESDERARRDNDQRKEAQARAGAGKSGASADNRVQQAPLSLSREEVQLIRDYIKPAPFSAPAAAPINVGDAVSGGTIPLPSPLTDKIPKLLGARFAIRNGAIVIVKRDSRQADAVLPAN
jgi:hypothetical protein